MLCKYLGYCRYEDLRGASSGVLLVNSFAEYQGCAALRSWGAGALVEGVGLVVWAAEPEGIHNELFHSLSSLGVEALKLL